MKMIGKLTIRRDDGTVLYEFVFDATNVAETGVFDAPIVQGNLKCYGWSIHPMISEITTTERSQTPQ